MSNKEKKYYTLEELKVGMEVSLESLSRIYDVRICLLRESLKDLKGDTYGKIAYIGNGDYREVGLELKDICVIKHYRNPERIVILED